MRLLFLTNVFPSPLEPTKGVFNLDLVRALADAHQVRVLSPISWLTELQARIRGASLGAERRALRDDVDIHYPRFYYTPGILRQFYGSFLWRSVRPTLKAHLDADPPDAVLGYWAHPDGEVAVRVARRLNVPAVVMVGGSDVLILARDQSRRRRIATVLQQADAVVATSQDLRTRVIEMGIAPSKIHVVSRGVDTRLFSPGDKKEARRRLRIFPSAGAVLLWVGRMVPVKGLDILLHACALLQQSGLAFHLCLVGDGPLRGWVEQQCRALGVPTTLPGAVPHEDLPDWYRAADLTVLPSRSEGVPNVLRESLACGTPFVASRVGGIPEIAPCPERQLVPPEDAQALAFTISRALISPPVPEIETRPASIAHSAGCLIRIIEPLVEQDQQSRARRPMQPLRRQGSRFGLGGARAVCDSDDMEQAIVHGRSQ
jgi:glycosyltransferase involved in cell wall biosynthesis